MKANAPDTSREILCYGVLLLVHQLANTTQVRSCEVRSLPVIQSIRQRKGMREFTFTQLSPLLLLSVATHFLHGVYEPRQGTG